MTRHADTYGTQVECNFIRYLGRGKWSEVVGGSRYRLLCKYRNALMDRTRWGSIKSPREVFVFIENEIAECRS